MPVRMKNRDALRELRHLGFVEVRSNKHNIWKHPETGRIVTFPHNPGNKDMTSASTITHQLMAAIKEHQEYRRMREKKVFADISSIVPPAPLDTNISFGPLPPFKESQVAKPVPANQLKIRAVQRWLKADPERPIEDFTEAYHNLKYNELNELYGLTADDIRTLRLLWRIPLKGGSVSKDKGHQYIAEQGERQKKESTLPTQFKKRKLKDPSRAPGPITTRRLGESLTDVLSQAPVGPTPPYLPRDVSPSDPLSYPFAPSSDMEALAQRVAQIVLENMPSPQPVDYDKLAEGIISQFIKMYLNSDKLKEVRERI